ncbi:hypothetical protein B0H19DRAFT_940677 [Mycena capillaripes]|nr:hypothetical protein B0H19DRAFT_940677 [Mycena capillaripes]
MPQQIRDKNKQPIKEGDEVWTKMRGGKREGTVDKIVRTESEAEEAGVKHPPKVSYLLV